MHSKSFIMEIANYKKTIGLGLVILFSLFLVNVIIGRIPITHDSVWFNFREWWFPLSQLCQLVTVIFVAFNSKVQSSIVSKIGAVLYSILMLVYISNRITYHINGSSLLYLEGIFEYITSFLIFAPGLLLLVWGLRKLWLPIKIVTTISVVVSLIEDVIWTKLRPMYINMTEFSYEEFEKIEPLQNAVDTLIHINALIYLALVVLTIVWISMRQKAPSIKTNNIDLI